MSTYHRLLLLTTLASALLTFCVLQAGTVNFSSKQQSPSQQLQSTQQPQVAEYYAMAQPRMMTLVWQPCVENICLSDHGKIPTLQQSAIGI